MTKKSSNAKLYEKVIGLCANVHSIKDTIGEIIGEVKEHNKKLDVIQVDLNTVKVNLGNHLKHHDSIEKTKRFRTTITVAIAAIVTTIITVIFKFIL